MHKRYLMFCQKSFGDVCWVVPLSRNNGNWRFIGITYEKCNNPGRGTDPRCLYLWGICLLCSNYFKTKLVLEKNKHSNEAFVQDHLFCCGICSHEWCSHASNWSSHSLTFLLSNPLYEDVSAWAEFIGEFIHESMSGIFPVVVKTTN